jgi:ABC-2 type transport system permease protein
MKTMRHTLLEGLRITWVIAAKDLREAIKNRATLTVIGVAIFTVLLYRLMPGLTGGTHAPELIVYDAGQSQTINQLENGTAFYLVTFPNQTQMENRLAASEAAYLGLAIPADFDQNAAASKVQELQGYTIYWASPGKITSMRQAAEAELTRLAGAPVHIKPDLIRIFPSMTQNSLGNWAALAFVFTVMMISIQLIPNLMLEEKNTHTLYALRVSPASAWELAVGKVLAGGFYVLLSAAVVLVAYRGFMLHLLPFMFASLAGALFMVLVGLWVGLKVDSGGQLSMFVIVLILLLFIPVVVYQLSDLFGGNLGRMLGWMPTNLMFRLVQAAFGQPIQSAAVLLDTIILLAWALVVGVGLVWQIKRMDRSPSRKIRIIRKQSASTEAVIPSQSVVSMNSSIRASTGKPTSATSAKIPVVAWKPLQRSQNKIKPLRILGAIILKDLREALHNKVVLAILITSLMMVVVNSSLPLLLKYRSASLIFVVDPGSSQVLRSLKNNTALTIRPVGNQVQLEQALSASLQTSLGVVLPVDFDQRLAKGETVWLTGYAIHWVDLAKVKNLAEKFQNALNQANAGQVAFTSETRRVYPAEGFSGQPFMIGMIMILLLLTMGIALTPVLVIEEKENHTIDALMVSPAKPQHIVIGKAMVGVVFGLLTAAVILSTNSYLFVHWDVILLAIMVCLVFSVSLGLLLGAFCENPATLGLWGVLVMLFLIGSILATAFQGTGMPQWLSDLLRWLPGTAMLKLVNQSMTGTPDAWVLLSNASVLVTLGLLFLGITVRKVKGWR